LKAAAACPSSKTMGIVSPQFAAIVADRVDRVVESGIDRYHCQVRTRSFVGVLEMRGTWAKIARYRGR